MKIGIINGSHRQAESQRVSKYVQKRLASDALASGGAEVETEIIDLAGNPLPLWDPGVWAVDNAEWKEVWSGPSAALKSSDAFVVVSPEWGGMVPAGLKNLFLLCSDFELAHKPALLVTVSSGVGGSYPVAELRMSSYKNTQICYLPVHVIVRSVAGMLGASEAVTEFDKAIRERMDHGLELLLRYAACMGPMRASLGNLLEQFPHGM